MVDNKDYMTHQDDMGTIHVSWDCGSSLGLIPGEDAWKKIKGLIYTYFHQKRLQNIVYIMVQI